MEILKLKVLRGPNQWSTYRTRLIELKLDLGKFEEFPTDKIDGFGARLETMIPSLYDHRCSEMEPGGFFERVRRGTWMGHVLEHIALEIQSLAGMPCGYGRTRGTDQKGIYNVVFTYTVEQAGIYAAKAALHIVEALIAGQDYDLSKDIAELERLHLRYGIGPSTRSIIDAAEKKGIPWRRLNDRSMLMLGQGINQRIIQATTTGNTSMIASEIASDKEETKRLLQNSFIPVPKGIKVYDEEELLEAIHELGFPLVIKPLNGNHGKGITVDLRTKEQILIAFEKAKKISRWVIVEKFIRGTDFRFLVINHKLEAVARRTPAMIIGDGHSNIRLLIDKVNADPNRGEGHEKILTKISVDDQTLSILENKGFTLDTVLPCDEMLFLKDTANLSTGGTARDVTEHVHPHNIFLAERIARLMDLDICGIDIVAEDISEPITQNNGAVLEVNAAPGFRMHLSPTRGIPRDVGEPVVRMLYPDGAPSRIPIVAVTGTNGKTTTTRLIAHIAKQAGKNTGYTTTDGIFIQGQQIYKGDCSGPTSAEAVLRDPIVDFAVLETARGGIIRSGLAFDKCNVSITTNITEDHLGLDGVNTLEDLAKIKSVVARSTFDDGFSILNADDDTVYGLKKELDCNIALFSTDADNERVIKHCSAGGWAAIIEKGYFTICKGEWRTRIAKVNDVPLTMDGRAGCMIKNVLPSILAAALFEIDTKIIRQALESFIPGPEFTPGRMNMFKIGGVDLMIDYVHNTDGFKQLKEFMQQVQSREKILVIGCTGDRRDDDIRTMARYAAEAFDKLIIRHDKDGRGRKDWELTQLIMEGIHSVKPQLTPLVISDEVEALDYAINHAGNGSFIVVSSDDIQRSIEYARRKMSPVKERMLIHQ